MREVKVLKQLPWLVLFLLLAAGITLWLLFVGEQQSHFKLRFQNQIERLADELLRGRLEGVLGPDSLPQEVKTFALYDPEGNLLGGWGDQVPPRLLPRPEPDARGGRILSHSGEWIEFLKVLEPLRPRMNVWDDDDHPPGPGPTNRLRGLGMRRAQGYLFVRVGAGPLEGGLWAWSLAAIAGSVAWAGFVVFVGVLWFRTRRYQEALTVHRELLQFAEASRTLSHELQNPLAAILLQTALLKRSAEGSPPAEVAIIEEEALRMSALVARVRDFLKDPHGQPEGIDLVELAHTLAGRFAVPVAIEVENPGPHRVWFDRHRLRSVVENLIKNAVESGSDPRPRVRLSKPRAGWVRLEVLDSGSGFTAASLKQALDPFYTTKTTGTGIGLSIADGFVRAAGGRLKLENRSEGGARVSLDLPGATGEAEA